MSGKYFVLGAVLIGLVIVSACSPTTGRLSSPAEWVAQDPQQLMTHGQKIYVEFCAECHQTDGTGWSTLYPRLAGNPIVTLHDPEPIIVTVKYGQGSMAAFGERISSPDIAAVLTYIRNSWGNHADPVSPRQVQ